MENLSKCDRSRSNLAESVVSIELSIGIVVVSEDSCNSVHDLTDGNSMRSNNLNFDRVGDCHASGATDLSKCDRSRLKKCYRGLWS